MSPNERTQISPPRGCVSCSNHVMFYVNYIETSGNKQAVRHECANGHPMHEMCGWRKPKIETVVIKL